MILRLKFEVNKDVLLKVSFSSRMVPKIKQQLKSRMPLKFKVIFLM